MAFYFSASDNRPLLPPARPPASLPLPFSVKQ